MKINWTPLFGVPLYRRLELLSISFFVFVFAFFGGISAVVIVYLLIAGNIYWKIICTLYLAFIIYDSETSSNGGRRIGLNWMRNWIVWKNAISYFPIDMVKTADLPPDRNYLICVYPHGILSVGAAGNFGSNYSKWQEFFPSVRPKLTTLKVMTLLPLAREVFLGVGMCSASADSLFNLLSQSNDPNAETNRDGCTSVAVGLINGGVREYHYTYPNTYRFVVAKRRGFIKIAFKTGASLVPAISFGENDYYHIVDYSKSKIWRWFMEGIFKQKINHFPPTCYGRGLLQSIWGLIPRRHPITTVIGAPIHLEKTENPTIEELNETHELFCNALRKLFDEHKSKYVENADKVHLEFV